MYGQSSSVDLNETQDKTIVLEYAELLNLNESTNEISNGLPPIPVVAANMIEPKQIGAIDCVDEYEPTTPMKAAITKQFETRAKDGRRRITPMFIPLEEDHGMYGFSEYAYKTFHLLASYFSQGLWHTETQQYFTSKPRNKTGWI